MSYKVISFKTWLKCLHISGATVTITHSYFLIANTGKLQYSTHALLSYIVSSPGHFCLFFIMLGWDGFTWCTRSRGLTWERNSWWEGTMTFLSKNIYYLPQLYGLRYSWKASLMVKQWVLHSVSTGVNICKTM